VFQVARDRLAYELARLAVLFLGCSLYLNQQVGWDESITRVHRSHDIEGSIQA
jgi:hypothetical protein